MFSTLRNRLHVSPATVIAAFALVFAMTGGAYAAKKYLITSTKQISPGVLKQLQGKAGPAGAPGSAGAQGSAGPAGPAGPGGAKGETGPAGGAGKDGAPGKDGATGKSGATGATGAAGTTGFTETLPAGKTETGTWWFEGNGGEVQAAPISFPIPLSPADAALITKENIQGGEESDTEFKEECPGTVREPKAEPGALCIYVGALEEFASLPSRITDPSDVSKQIHEGSGIGPTGGLLEFEGGHASDHAYGSFAVTAPKAE
jgi:hypothetical protein